MRKSRFSEEQSDLKSTRGPQVPTCFDKIWSKFRGRAPKR